MFFNYQQMVLPVSELRSQLYKGIQSKRLDSTFSFKIFPVFKFCTKPETLMEYLEEVIAPYINYIHSNSDKLTHDFFESTIIIMYMFSHQLVEFSDRIDVFSKDFNLIYDLLTKVFNFPTTTSQRKFVTSSLDYDNPQVKNLYVNQNLLNNTKYSFVQYIASSGILNVNSTSLYNKEFSKFYKKVGLLLAPFLVTEFCDYLAIKLADYYENIDILTFLISLHLSQQNYDIVSALFFDKISELMKDNMDSCMECLHSISQTSSPLTLAALKEFMVDKGFALFKHNDYLEQLKFLLQKISSLLSNEELYSILRLNNNLIESVTQYQTDLAPDIIEILANININAALPFVIDLFEKNNADFKDPRNIIYLVLLHGSINDFNKIMASAANYKDIFIDLIQNNKDFDPSYLITICKVIKNLSLEVNCLQEISDSLMDSLDSLDVAKVFADYDFLPISDQEYFCLITPNCQNRYLALKKRNLHYKISDTENKGWVDYAIQCFDETKDVFFAEQLAKTNNKEIIQKLINELKSVDFMLSKTNLTDFDFTNVIPRDYSQEILKDKNNFVLIHKIPKFKFNFDANLAETVCKLLNSENEVICGYYYLDNAIEYAGEEFWSKISEIPLKNDFNFLPVIHFYSMLKIGKFDTIYMSKILSQLIKSNNDKAVIDFIEKLGDNKIDFRSLKNTKLPNSNFVINLLKQCDNLTPELADEAFLTFPIKSFRYLATKSDKGEIFQNNLKSRLNTLLAGQITIPEFEEIIDVYFDITENEFALELAFQLFTTEFTPIFRTNMFYKKISKVFADNFELFKCFLSECELAKTYSSPFIKALGEMSLFVNSSDSKLAKDASDAAKNKNVSGYQTANDILSKLPKRFEMTFLEKNITDNEVKYVTENHFNLTNCDSINSGISDTFSVYEDLEENKIIRKQRYLTKTPKYFVISLFSSSNDTKVDEQIDLTDYILQSGKTAVYRLCSYVGKKNDKYHLNQFSPVLAFYQKQKSETYLSYKPDEKKSEIIEEIMKLDFEVFDKFELSFFMFNELNSADLFEYFCQNDPSFIESCVESNLSEICQLSSDKISIFGELIKDYEDTDLLRQLLLDLLTKPETISNAVSLLISKTKDIKEVFEIFVSNHIPLKPLLQNVTDQIITFDDSMISMIMKDKEAMYYILSLADYKFIQFFLPLSKISEEEFDKISKIVPSDYLSEMLIRNGNKVFAKKFNSQCQDNEKFKAFIGEINEKSILEMLNSNSISTIENSVHLAAESNLVGKLDNECIRGILSIIHSDICTEQNLSRLRCYLDLLGNKSLFPKSESNYLISYIYRCARNRIEYSFYNQILPLENFDWAVGTAIIAFNPSMNLIEIAFIASLKLYSYFAVKNLEKYNDALTFDFIEVVANEIHKQLAKKDIDQNLIRWYHDILLRFPRVWNFVKPIFDDGTFGVINDKEGFLLVALIALFDSGFTYPNEEKRLMSDYVFSYFAKNQNLIPQEYDVRVQTIMNMISGFKWMSDTNYMVDKLHFFANASFVFPFIRSYIFQNNFVGNIKTLYSNIIPVDVCNELSYLVQILLQKSLITEVISSSHDITSTARMLFDSFDICKKSWPATEILIDCLLKIKSSNVKDVVKYIDLDGFYKCLKVIPMDYRWMNIRIIIVYLMNANNNSIDLNDIRSFINTIKVEKEEQERVAIAANIIRKLPEKWPIILKNEFDSKFKQMRQIPELEKYVKILY
ncbi:hypothetical protein TVAG_211290 [Trichomonas vaginalis G3]|uniref:Uncharacterized protein n=1 Tax=Trichomonas vaginalis (strain ATCC PRA-98 / G3) TaxID=412133 RepID=A2EKX1_TRIV3|nr:hypothetical protein TVAGG3_1014410 [Trichomonas vaginalis G3]EAY06679.1 hypothetical protein TVAG_211290 [Trichomonas vaginalis G3]KAI5491727.1 hypothetical protein TVAGG3_1014410 [Trichomonas vaginalis G3]|eukprot:XP_001318902.1 hypothetical protein [Trichomonas vaginalis G3]